MNPSPLCTEWIVLTVLRADGTTERLCAPANKKLWSHGMVFYEAEIHQAEVATLAERMQDNCAYMEAHTPSAPFLSPNIRGGREIDQALTQRERDSYRAGKRHSNLELGAR